jgi:large subunit ribosomal protein L18
MSNVRKKKIFGTPDKPRLVVYRSQKYIYGQIIDDSAHKVLISASNLAKGMTQELKKVKNKTDASRIVGKKLAEEAKKKKIEQVVFDRNGYIYHGRIKAFADGAREGGLKF